MARVAYRNLSIWKKIGSNVRSSRKWRGLNDIQVSEKLGMGLSTYRKIEIGQTQSVTLKELIDIINLLKVDVEVIFLLFL